MGKIGAFVGPLNWKLNYGIYENFDNYSIYAGNIVCDRSQVMINEDPCGVYDEDG